MVVVSIIKALQSLWQGCEIRCHVLCLMLRLFLFHLPARQIQTIKLKGQSDNRIEHVHRRNLIVAVISVSDG